MHATPDRDQARHFRLLDLPKEIRLLIFEYTLSGRAVYFPNLGQASEREEFNVHEQRYMAITATCRLVHEESSPFRYVDSYYWTRNVESDRVPWFFSKEVTAMKIGLYELLPGNWQSYYSALSQHRFPKLRLVRLVSAEDIPSTLFYQENWEAKVRTASRQILATAFGCPPAELDIILNKFDGLRMIFRGGFDDGGDYCVSFMLRPCVRHADRRSSMN
jgi:hypothetical protein